ncbi:siderophore-interacting protein [Mucilaginibacter sp. dw_454]|uniref:siderophore-interacting protein n=1 Tax=Mucilaginibacter sp. dw_454 TaxID=2720079 RepID=UPI001BD48EE2|nr:siderophore-interacting protein [Mucilaginibacter sp. dw_454]
METSIIQKLKNRTAQLLEAPLLKSGRVLDVRHWENAAMVEIDLHLPEAPMADWHEVPSIKFKAASFTYRDYTPFGWDAETHTCSLLIDTAHEGPGSRWARNLQAGETIHYLAIENTRQSPHPTDLVVGLGDASSLAHLLALQQLTLPKNRFDGAVVLDNPHAGHLFQDYFRSALTILSSPDELTGWLAAQGYCTTHTRFYLTGHNGLVAVMRRSLKNLGHSNFKVKGFWS